MTKKTAFFYDSRISATAALRFQIPDGMVALDCSNARVAEIAKKLRILPPCIVVDEIVYAGSDLSKFLIKSSSRPAVVRYFTTTVSDDDINYNDIEINKPKKVETTVERGLRLAAEREKLFGSEESRRQL
jgi:hypothetical protein